MPLYNDLATGGSQGLSSRSRDRAGDAGASVERVAGHIVLGAETGDEEAVVWLRAAADAAAARSPATAVHLLTQALEISDADDSSRQDLVAEMVPPLLAVGRLREAEALARAVLADGPDVGVESWSAPVWRVSFRRARGIRKPSTSWSGRRSPRPEQDRLSLDAAAVDAPRAGRPDRPCS